MDPADSPAAPARVLFWVIGVIVCADVGLGLVVPLWALRARQLGASAASVGALVAVLGAGRLLASLAGGLASDRWGRRPVLIVGLLALAAAAVGGATVRQLWALYPLRLLEGAGWEIMAVSGIAAVADIARDSRRQGRLMSRYQAARRGAQAVSPLLGGALAVVVGLSGVFWLYAALAAVAATTAVVTLPALPAAGPRPAAPAAFVRQPVFLAVSALGFLLTGADLTFQQVLVPLIGTARGLSTPQLGAVLAAFGLLLAGTSLTVGGRAIDRIGPRWPLLVGVVVGGVGYGLVSVLGGFTGLVVALAVAGFGRGLSSAAPTLLLLRHFPAHQGRVQGSFRTVNGVGRLVTPLTLGALAAGTPSVIWGLTAALAAASVAVWSVTLPARRVCDRHGTHRSRPVR